MTEQVDGNVRWENQDGPRRYYCSHCDGYLGDDDNYFSRLSYYEGPVSLAGPQVFQNSSVYVDAHVIFSQYCCPHCDTAFLTQVVPVSDNHYRSRRKSKVLRP